MITFRVWTLDPEFRTVYSVYLIYFDSNFHLEQITNDNKVGRWLFHINLGQCHKLPSTDPTYFDWRIYWNNLFWQDYIEMMIVIMDILKVLHTLTKLCLKIGISQNFHLISCLSTEISMNSVIRACKIEKKQPIFASGCSERMWKICEFKTFEI